MLLTAKFAFKGIFLRSKPFCPSKKFDKDTKKYGNRMR